MLTPDNRPYGKKVSPLVRFMCAIAIGAWVGSMIAFMIAFCTSSALVVASLTGGIFGCVLTLCSVVLFVDSIVIRKPGESLRCRNLTKWGCKNFTKLTINFAIPIVFGVSIGAEVNFMLGAGIATTANAVFPSTMLIRGCPAAFLGSSMLQGAAIGMITVMAVLGALWIANNIVDYTAECFSPTKKVNSNIDEATVNPNAGHAIQ